jgi:hypothetical protein
LRSATITVSRARRFDISRPQLRLRRRRDEALRRRTGRPRRTGTAKANAKVPAPMTVTGHKR